MIRARFRSVSDALRAFRRRRRTSSTSACLRPASQDPRFRDNPLVTGAPNIRFYAGVPIRSSAGLALGTLCVIDDRPRTLSQEELDTLCELGDLASKEVKLRETLLLSSSRLERSREILDASEVRYRSMFELASVGIGFLSPEGGWISVNQSLCDIVGYREDELNRLSFQDITRPDDLATDLLQLQRLVNGAIEHHQTETRYVRRNGRPVWISLNVSSKTAESGKQEYFVAIIKDIHARKVAEEALHVIQDELEDRVILRTRELREANAQLLGAIKRQRESDHALRRRTAELSAVIEHADDACVSMDVGAGHRMEPKGRGAVSVVCRGSDRAASGKADHRARGGPSTCRERGKRPADGRGSRSRSGTRTDCTAA